ncbi:MAG: hypothetical protein R3D03_05745 [Geminicoccaceae bacterium]
MAVVTNGTAVLGLGSIGPLAAKPVMEGSAVCSRNLPVSMRSISRSNLTGSDKLADIVESLNRPSAP